MSKQTPGTDSPGIEPVAPEDADATSPEPEAPADAEDVAPATLPPTDWRGIERRQRFTVIAATALLALTYFGSLAASGDPAAALRDADARAYFAYLPSLVLDRDLDLSNQFEVLGAAADGGYPFGEIADGYAANPYSIAPALLWLPGYLGGVVVDRLLGWRGVDTGPDGYGVGAIWGVALSSIVLAGFAADLSRRVAAQLRGPEDAMPAMFFAWVGTAAVLHTLRDPIHPQSASWFCLALTLWLGWVAHRDDADRYRWPLAGLVAGVLLGIRLQDAPLLIVPGLLLLASCRERRDLSRTGGKVLAGMLAGYLPAAAVGFWLAPAASAGVEPSITALVRALFSPREGWLVSTPLVAVGIAGLALMARGSRSSVVRTLAWGSIAALALSVIIDATTDPSTGLAGLRFVAATPLLILGLARVLGALDNNPGRRRTGFIALLALAAANLWLLFGR